MKHSVYAVKRYGLTLFLLLPLILPIVFRIEHVVSVFSTGYVPEETAGRQGQVALRPPCCETRPGGIMYSFCGRVSVKCWHSKDSKAVMWEISMLLCWMCEMTFKHCPLRQLETQQRNYSQWSYSTFNHFVWVNIMFCFTKVFYITCSLQHYESSDRLIWILFRRKGTAYRTVLDLIQNSFGHSTMGSTYHLIQHQHALFSLCIAMRSAHWNSLNASPRMGPGFLICSRWRSPESGS